MRLSSIAPVLGALALSLSAVSAASAAVVYSGPVNLTVPNTTTGLYLNFLDGTTYTGPGVFPVLGGPGANYDFNIFGTATYSLFAPGTSGESAPAVPATSRGYLTDAAGNPAVNLAPGAPIGPTGIYNTAGGSASNLTTGVPALLGVRFRNEGPDLTTDADDTVHFAWVRLSLVDGQPGTLIDYAYESTPGTAILAGDIGVPEPASLGLLAAGAGLLLRRRRAVA